MSRQVAARLTACRTSCSHPPVRSRSSKLGSSESDCLHQTQTGGCRCRVEGAGLQTITPSTSTLRLTRANATSWVVRSPRIPHISLTDLPGSGGVRGDDVTAFVLSRAGRPRRPGNGMLLSKGSGRRCSWPDQHHRRSAQGARRWRNQLRTGDQNGTPRGHSSGVRRSRERAALPRARSAITRSAHFRMSTPARTGGERQLTKRAWEG